ncbi:outer membrane protein [Serratia sp. UGAL515B_01]|uniref:outer membrane protein n=1 Tax=Serratia sp. UGAL515B_01 TaxID=2986763 RepID=UPI003985E0E0
MLGSPAVLPFYRSVFSSNFAWAVGVGVNWALTDNVSLNLSYRYVDAGKVEADYTTRRGSSETAKVSVTSNDCCSPTHAIALTYCGLTIIILFFFISIISFFCPFFLLAPMRSTLFW